MEGMGDERILSVAAYPVPAWRIEVLNDSAHRGFEYVRCELDVARRTKTAHPGPHYILAFTGGPQGELGI